MSEKWAAAWRRNPDRTPERRDEMFAHARERGEMKECLDGLLASVPYDQPMTSTDLALVQVIANETIFGPPR